MSKNLLHDSCQNVIVHFLCEKFGGGVLWINNTCSVTQGQHRQDGILIVCGKADVDYQRGFSNSINSILQANVKWNKSFPDLDM